MADLRKILNDSRKGIRPQAKPPAPSPQAAAPPGAIAQELPEPKAEAPAAAGPEPLAVEPAPEPRKCSAAPEAPHVPDAYQRDTLERAAFENAKHTILYGTAPRIRFGRVLSSQIVEQGGVIAKESDPCCDSETGHAPGYIWGLGQRPRHMAGHLSLVGAAKKAGIEEGDERLYKIFVEASKDLRRHSLDPEAGPFADKEGTIQELADFMFEGILPEDLKAHIERVIDMRAFIDAHTEAMHPRFFPAYNFTLNERVETPDELSRAGAILCQNERLQKDEVTGSAQIALVHPMEQYVLAVAALRARGFPAYVSQAVIPAGDGEEISSPLIAVLDLAASEPLITFDMFRAHPNMGAIDILSDTAVEGALYAMLAEARVRHLAYHIVREGGEGREMEPDQFGNQLVRIARPLFESVKRWDGNHFIPRAMTALANNVADAILVSDIARLAKANDEEKAAQVRGVAVQILQSGSDPRYIPAYDPLVLAAKEVALDVHSVSRNAVSTVQALLEKWISDAARDGPESLR